MVAEKKRDGLTKKPGSRPALVTSVKVVENPGVDEWPSVMRRRLLQ